MDSSEEEEDESRSISVQNDIKKWYMSAKIV
jgi:hypothetical protein